jgi:hypothetical protein
MVWQTPAAPPNETRSTSLDLTTTPDSWTKLKRLDSRLGREVQVDPVKPELKLPGTKSLKLNVDVLLLTSALKFNLRRYTWGWAMPMPIPAQPPPPPQVGRGLHSSTILLILSRFCP